MRRLLVALALALALGGFPAQAWAHQVETFYTLDSQLEFQSLFSSGEPFVGATVNIYAPNNPDEPWMTTTTDSEGRFAFLPDESIPGDWEVSIEDDTQSHADYWTVPVGDKGIVYDGISLDSTEDVHYRAATAFMPLAISIGGALAWLGLSRRRR
ncbi:carboxypeptidase regulatory-like domain-containing protein [Nodosilinea sp. LEGE 07088]|uniref:carboxypeptidase-like regulatory domain-containing protein n=1 Tax=Nodosilinea sp. LEGE 07088 TaxID=2777968 RepID=UPI001880D20D|nr:carboxypeptidase-like regulatory domain-containing protein [Nodosilinea sp. LEGE 07088]MBE9138285.1 carboxypeptidase regulatory-like domain-containing protein [Nodosilinea sp. LEGE 07088]